MTTRQKRLAAGLLFVSPWLVGFALFLGYPLVASLYYSFCDYSVLERPVFIGVANYQDLARDSLFWKSLSNTLIYAALALPLGLLVSLSLALLLNTHVRCRPLYRTIFFLPTLVPAVALSTLWLWVYNTDAGVLNRILMAAGVSHPPDWLGDPLLVKPALAFMAVWGAGHSVVILLAGLQDVPAELQEAALIDGAGFWGRLWNVTLPMISPVIYFNLVVGLIGAFQIFAQPYMMTNGGPERASLLYGLYLYQLAFEDLRMGTASAMGWILFVIIVTLTLAVTRLSKRWVVYER